MYIYIKFNSICSIKLLQLTIAFFSNLKTKLIYFIAHWKKNKREKPSTNSAQHQHC